jgi:peptidoglycan/LPS O-acetylase OafA/YrhL
LRLDFLDGLRGIAALYVVIHHAFLVYLCEKTRVPTPALAGAWIFDGGRIAVAIFIVLSGFCLMMPVVQSGTGQLKGGMTRYLKRRALRILPPYYATILLTTAMIFVLPPLQRTDGAFWHNALPVDAGSFLSHLGMVHILKQEWHMRISIPCWTVATEWWIYFLFPLLLLPIWRKWGAFASALTGILVGCVPHLFLKETQYGLDWAAPWYLGLFAMGMTGAVVCFDHKRSAILDLARRFAWIGALAFIAITTALILRTNWHGTKLMLFDVLYGAAATFLIIHCATRRSDWLRIGLESHVAMLLGAISYSLYLIHTPILVLVHRWTQPWHSSASAVLAISLLMGVPIAVLVCSLFYLVFERPFLTVRAKLGSVAAKAQLIDPELQEA